jgi:hypothetical protein
MAFRSLSINLHYTQNPLPRVLSDGDSVQQHGVKGQVLAITSYTLAVPDWRPSPILRFLRPKRFPYAPS